MSITLTAPVIEEAIPKAIIAALQTDLPATLAALEGVESDGLTLTAPRGWFLSDMGETVVANCLPAVIVKNRGCEDVQWLVAANARRETYRIEIDVHIACDANRAVDGYSFEQASELQILRYCACVKAVLANSTNLQLDNLVASCLVRSTSFSNILMLENAFARACRIELDVTTGIQT